MGLLDFFRRHATKATLSSDELRDRLFAAFRLADSSKFEALANLHRDQIVRDIRNWMKVPEPISQNKTESDYYVQMLCWLMALWRTLAKKI